MLATAWSNIFSPLERDVDLQLTTRRITKIFAVIRLTPYRLSFVGQDESIIDMKNNTYSLLTKPYPG